MFVGKRDRDGDVWVERAELWHLMGVEQAFPWSYVERFGPFTDVLVEGDCLPGSGLYGVRVPGDARVVA